MQCDTFDWLNLPKTVQSIRNSKIGIIRDGKLNLKSHWVVIQAVNLYVLRIILLLKMLEMFPTEQGPKKELIPSCFYVSAYLELFLKIHSQKKMENYNAQKDLSGHILCNNTLFWGVNIQSDKCSIDQSVGRKEKACG